MDVKKITHIQNDALQQVVNIGTNHAINAFAEMIGKKVSITLPNVSLIPIMEVPGRISKNVNIDEPIVGLYFKILGDLSGNILLILPQESASLLAKMLLNPSSSMSQGNPKDETEKCEIEKSALMEAGNVLTNSYLNALSNITDFTLFPSIPHYAQDMLGAVLDYLLIDISRTSDTALFTEAHFSSDEISLSGDFLIFPDSESLEKILSRVGMA